MVNNIQQKALALVKAEEKIEIQDHCLITKPLKDTWVHDLISITNKNANIADFPSTKLDSLIFYSTSANHIGNNTIEVYKTDILNGRFAIVVKKLKSQTAYIFEISNRLKLSLTSKLDHDEILQHEE